mmetsp:Transcript_38870/g.77113  ORF Transcript_38870/g.77113 Transcript_38870/m.77113 type:complete len:202 (+) Transcript_38870:333-938(+)
MCTWRRNGAAWVKCGKSWARTSACWIDRQGPRSHLCAPSQLRTASNGRPQPAARRKYLRPLQPPVPLVLLLQATVCSCPCGGHDGQQRTAQCSSRASGIGWRSGSHGGRSRPAYRNKVACLHNKRRIQSSLTTLCTGSQTPLWFGPARQRLLQRRFSRTGLRPPRMGFHPARLRRLRFAALRLLQRNARTMRRHRKFQNFT